ncbi:DUF3857 domain-containing protein [Chryseobacterium sp. JAH]|uniref:DUF3857 domain-containing protein n=1 Tax=Chryseobacterium sp. JAH TaxID=1742858 RepID=UPI0006480D6A|nr:DUF3857 domain-containing protein [Chryseobacterium sp. JAH]KUJ52349.1 hypothetical protein AR685_04830 [Chryseobacterium sp. JAH]
MTVKTIATLVLCIFAQNLLISQNNKFLIRPSFDEKDLKKEYSAIEKNAPAEIIYNSVRYNIKGLSAEKTFFSKIKIFDKKRSEEWLNIQIPVLEGEKLDDFEVNVYNYINGQVDKISIKQKEQLKENFIKGLKFYKLAIPNIVDGSVIEYSYKLTTGITNLTYYLQYSIPVIYQEYSLEAPEALTYLFDSTGSILNPKYYISTNEDRLRVNYKIYRFGFDNMKSTQNEKYVKNIDRYRSKVKPELKKFLNIEMAENWNKVAERFNDNEKFGGFLKGNVKDVVPENIRTFYNPLERANKIFDFVKFEYKWNKYPGFIASQSVKQLIKSRSGNAADINLLLVSLFRNAGLNANPFLISTVDNGILNIFSPNVNSLNFVIACVKIDNILYLYDATSFNSKVNMLPERDWNDFGILFEGKKATDVSLSNTNVSKKNFEIEAVIDVVNSSVEGSFAKKETGLYAIESYDSYDINKDKYNQSFKTEFNSDMKDVDSKILSNGDFESKMRFSSTAALDMVGKKIIINPLLFLNSENEIFDQIEERKNQIDFISAFTREKKVEITIPEGYEISEVPKPKKISTDDKEIIYNYTVNIVNDKITVISKVEVASPTYVKEYYPIFKKIWKVISDSENQVMSLIKK